MKVYAHVVTDQDSPHEDRYFGVSEDPEGTGYQEANDWINAHQEYRGGERYEYDRYEVEIQFKWDMIEKEFKACMRPGKDWDGIDTSDYLGALFFGDFKLEFIWNDVSGPYNNLFFWGAEYNKGQAYSYLEDGTPYEEIDPPFVIPKRRTFESFAKNIEKQVIDWLNGNTEYIEYALEITKPTKWYPDGQCNVTRDITRIA